MPDFLLLNGLVFWVRVNFKLIEHFSDRLPWWGNQSFEFGLDRNEAVRWSIGLIERFKDLWSWKELSVNQALPWSIELVERYEARWDWGRYRGLSSNEALPWTIDLIERFVGRWDWKELSKNTALPWSLELFERFASRWDWKVLSLNEGLPWSLDLIERFEDRLFSRKRFFSNCGLASSETIPWSLELIKRVGNRCDWEGLARNKSLPWSLDLIEHFEHCSWLWKMLAGNKALLLLQLRPADIVEIMTHHFADIDSQPALSAA